MRCSVRPCVFGVLGEAGYRPRQCLLRGAEQARLAGLDRHDVAGVLDAHEVFGSGPLGLCGHLVVPGARRRSNHHGQQKPQLVA